MILFCRIRVYYHEKQAMKKVKTLNNEASKGCISIHKDRLLGADEIISEFFIFCIETFFWAQMQIINVQDSSLGHLWDPVAVFQKFIKYIDFFLNQVATWLYYSSSFCFL